MYDNKGEKIFKLENLKLTDIICVYNLDLLVKRKSRQFI